MARAKALEPISNLCRDSPGSLTIDSIDRCVHCLQFVLGQYSPIPGTDAGTNIVLDLFSGGSSTVFAIALHGFDCIALDRKASALCKSKKLFENKISSLAEFGQRLTWCLGDPLELSKFSVRGVTVLNAFAIPASCVDEQLHCLDLMDTVETLHTIVIHVPNVLKALKKVVSKKKVDNLIPEDEATRYQEWWDLLTSDKEKEKETKLQRTIQFRFDVQMETRPDTNVAMAIISVMRDEGDRVNGSPPRFCDHLDFYAVPSSKKFRSSKVKTWVQAHRAKNKKEKMEQKEQKETFVTKKRKRN